MKRPIIRLLLYTSLLFFGIPAGLLRAQVKLPRLISDGMVLQRNTKIPIWGWASPGDKIRVTFNGKQYTAYTGTDKKWSLLLPPMKAGGPYSMEIEGTNHIIIKDILVGDVWVCSGQSNMEFWMERVKARYADAIASSDNPKIRQFLVKQKYNFASPEDDTESDGWKTATPENVLRFTAVGYFFARSLYDKYRVPVGLIHSSRGGSPAEAWMSQEALKPFPDYYNEALRLKDSLLIKKIRTADEQATSDWFLRTKTEDQGTADSNHLWYSADYPAEDWNELQVPGFWEKPGMKNSDGVIWFRKEIELPAEMASRNAVIYLGSIADDDDTYFNGVRIGSVNSRYFLREYRVPSNLLKSGKNMIVIRVVNKNGPGGFIKDKPYKLVAGDKSVSLEGTWKYKAGVILPPLPRTTVFPYKPLGLYQAMIAPLTTYGIKGVIWYQGEANTNRAAEYRKLFPQLIADWRRQWHSGSFPFLYVQLASYLPAANEPSESQWAELREAQLMTLSVPNTGMAVTIDIGEWNDVHPENKEDVGKRLALAARKVAFHEKELVYSGPLYQSKKIKGNKIILSFSHTGGGLTTKTGEPLRYFSIAGKDGRFVWAKTRIAGNKVIVWNDQISEPVHVRYAWADNPEGANLYNKEGLPASPFRTDNPPR